MTLAATKRCALGLCGAAGALAAVTSGALISAVINAPDQVTAAMSDGDLRVLLGLALDRLASAATLLLRYL